MAISLTSPQRAQLRGRNLGMRILVRFNFSGVIYRFTDHDQTITWDGFDWIGAGQLATLSARGLSAGASTDGLSIQINGAGLATPEDPSGATLLATIYDEAKQWDFVDLYYLYFDAQTGVPIFSVSLLAGRLSGAPLSRQPGGDAVMTLEIESDDILLDRSPGRTRSDSDQKRMWPIGGGGFHLAGSAAAQGGSVWWGQDAPQTAGMVSGGGSYSGGGGGRNSFDDNQYLR
jgi:Uncharacterized conserved protein (DUF2163)